MFLGHPPRCGVQLQRTKKEHPILEGVGDFEIRDEHYNMELTCTDADIFMESVSEKGGTQPAGYTRLLGEGRLCALTPGHTLDVWENEQFMRMFTNAMEWCLKAYEHGDGIVANRIAVLYAMGQGVEQDEEKAMYWYTAAAQAGSKAAQYNIGKFYELGRGVEQDYAAAIEWFKKSIETEPDYVNAMEQIGWMYTQGGYGIGKDHAAALEWMMKAYEKGSAYAASVAGWAYWVGGYGVEQDYAAALEWYTKAAELGDAESMYWVSEIYRRGLTAEADEALAAEWLEKAIANGYVPAE